MSAIINNFNGTYIERIENYIQNATNHTAEGKSVSTDSQDEEVTPIDISFFCVHRFTADIIEKNIRQAIAQASSKADACRRIMSLEAQGYILLSNVTDEEKAKLLNPFAEPKYSLTGEDFKKARNR